MYYRMDGKKSGKVVFSTIFKSIMKGEHFGLWMINFYDDESGDRDAMIIFETPYFQTKYQALHYVDSFARKSGKTVLNITILNNY